MFHLCIEIIYSWQFHIFLMQELCMNQINEAVWEKCKGDVLVRQI